jgi:hypothetical protein
VRGGLSLLLLGLTAAGLWAADGLPVTIRGDELVYQADKISASGNARLVYDGREVLADRIFIDTRSSRVEVYGLKAALRPDLTAQKFYINFKDGASVLNAERWSGTRAGLTSCDLLEPHYRLAAKEFLYYPDDKIVAYHLTAHFWFVPAPLFYTPYYVFYTGPSRLIFTFPKVGSNTVEGNFIKTETLYFLDADNAGGVYWDAMSLKGNGSGFWHSYDYGQPGYFSFYQVSEQDTRPIRNSLILNWRQRLNFADDNQLDLEHRYRKTYLLPQGYDDSLSDVLRYAYRSQDTADRLNAEYSFREDYQAAREQQNFQTNSTLGAQTNKTVWQKEFRRSDGYRYEALNINESFQLNNEWRYSINPVYYRAKTANDKFYEQRLDLAHSLELTPQEKKFFEKMTAEAKYYYDLDNDQVTTDALSAEWVEKAPEITVKAVRQNILGADEETALFSIDSSYSSGWIRESKYFSAYAKRRFFETAKYTANYNFFKTFELPYALANVTLLESYNQAAYGTQDQHYQLSDRPYLLADWWGFFKNKLEYEQTQGEGGSPFFYDDPKQYHTKRGKHTVGFYQGRSWELSAVLGKDFENNLYDDDLYNLRLDPWANGLLKFNLSTGQSRYTALYRDLIGGLQLGFGKNAGRLSFTKDLNKNFEENAYAGKLKTASSELDFYLGEPYRENSVWNFWTSEWHFLLKNTYDFYTEYFNLDTFGLGKDLHCWYMRYNFTPLRKEWYVVFSLKAFPEQEFKLTGNEDNEFNFDAFSDALNATEVRRYE